MKRILTLSLQIFLLLLLQTSCEKVKPNIIFVLVDDVGWNDIGFHGSQQIKTPAIDALSKEGVILNNYYALPLCSPSRAALMTGRYPMTYGMQFYLIQGGQPVGIPLNYKLLPEYLNDLGYESHMVGKWHLGCFHTNYTPTYRGFSTFQGYYGQTADYFSHRAEDDDLADPFNPWMGLDLHLNEGTKLSAVDTEFGQYSTRLYTNRATEIISKHNFTSKPLFLYFALSNVHVANDLDPIQVPEDTESLFKDIWHPLRRKFVANAFEMDIAVRQVMQSLSLRRVLENTIVVFSSDNGGQPNGFNGNWGSNFPLRGSKAYYFEGGVRIPAFVWGKMFKSRSGQVSKDLMFISDWLPTLYAAAGGNIENLGDIDGYNMLAVLTGQNKTCPRSEILINIDPIGNTKAIKVGRYKYILNPDNLHDATYDYWFEAPGNLPYTNETMLPNSTASQIWCGDIPRNVDHRCRSIPTGLRECMFDIENDPCEYHNLVDDPEYQEVKVKLLERVAFWETKQVEPLVPPKDAYANPKYHNWVWEPWRDSPQIPPNPQRYNEYEAEVAL